VTRPRALVFAQADRAHLRQTALQRAFEVGVRLHPVQQEHAVGLPAGLADKRLDTLGSRAEAACVHRVADRDTEVLGGDPVVREQIALPFGGRAAVAAHRRDDERLVSPRLELGDRRPRDRGDVRDPAAAEGDADLGAGGQRPRGKDLSHGGARRRCDVGHDRSGEPDGHRREAELCHIHSS